jgi:undecaprenyl-diphosphatase
VKHALARTPLAWLARLGAHERGLLLAIVLLLGGVWGFVELASEVTDGNTLAIDRAILLSLRNPQDPADPLGPKWVEELGRDLTALGGAGILSGLTAAVCGFLLLDRKRRAAAFVAVASIGALAASVLLKELYDRPRPDLVPHGSFVYTSSFPSGHSMLSAAVYLTLAALLGRTQARRRVRAYLLLWALFIAAAVGVSRVYLGVHWPTDVLSGWTAGALWALICWSVASKLQRRGTMEPPGQTSHARTPPSAVPLPRAE